MVHVKHRGRLGNQMCQYAIGRIIAEAKGYKLVTEPSDSIVLTDYFPHATNLSGTEITTNEKSFGIDFRYGTIQHLDMDDALKHNGTIYLRGYWQKHYLYTPHIDKLKKWFEYDESVYERPSPDDIVVHVRLTDFLIGKWSLPPKVYIDMVNRMGDYNRCIIHTDEPKSPVLDEFKSLKNVVIKDVNTMASFTMLKCAKRLVISQSSFGFWAAILGDQDVVYAPVNVNNGLMWKCNPGPDDIDLIPSSNKYVKVKV